MRVPKGIALFSGAVVAIVLLAAGHPHAQRPLPPLAATPEQRPSFKTAVRLTTVTATVTDADGRLVSDLPRERFEVFEDGLPQEVTQFTRDRVPVSLGILVDASDSMYGRRIQEARDAIGHFVADMLAPDDEFSLVTFNHRQQVLSEWTADRSAPARLLGPVKPWGATAIYDAILASIPLAEQRHNPRAALLVVSDGADTASDTQLRDLRSALRRTDLFIYAIGIDAPGRRPINAAVNPMTLGQITDQSGGRTRIVHDTSEVSAALEQIAQELNSQYLIGYTSARPNDGRFHSIRVHVKDGEYKVRARTGYVG